jgi:hypothetical protein
MHRKEYDATWLGGGVAGRLEMLFIRRLEATRCKHAVMIRQIATCEGL